MSVAFLYPYSDLSPHKVHLEWAKSVGAVPVQTPFGPKGLKFKEFKSIIRKLKNFKIFLLESLYSLPFVYFLKKQNKTIKIISIIADTSFYLPKLNILRRLYYKIFNLNTIDFFVTVSKEIKNWMINYFNISEEKINVCYPFSDLEVNKSEIEEKLKEEIKPIASFIGNRFKKIAAYRILKLSKLMKEWKFLIIGEASYGLKKSENFIPLGRVKNVKDFLFQSYFYLHFVDFDPFPVAVLEAMRCGNVPILFKHVGIKEILPANLRRELVISEFKEMEIKKKLEVLAIDQKKTKKIIKRLHNLSKNFRKEKSIKNFQKIFYNIIK